MTSTSVSAEYTLGTANVRSRFPALWSGALGSTLWIPANPRIAFESGVFLALRRFRYGAETFREYAVNVPLGVRFFPIPLLSFGVGFFFSGNTGKLVPGWARMDSGAALVVGGEYPVLDHATIFADLRTELGLTDLTEDADLANVSSTSAQLWIGLRFSR